MGQSCLNIGEGGENDETPRYMKIPMQDMMFGEVFVNPKYEAWKRRRLIKALQRPPRGIDARLAAKGVPPDSGFKTLVEELGLTMEAVAPYMSAFKPNTTGTDLMLPRIKIIRPKVIWREVSSDLLQIHQNQPVSKLKGCIITL
uniref:uncharacterized protein LOC122598479 n=1 Tax=Erigeron canadensis TaxID=72917 RepID=UPI001CB91AAA|nr:uncharacterized protein LOC122598479 [Erigeron canadensis]